MKESQTSGPHNEYPEKIKKAVEQSAPEKLAWAWQNFIKRTVNDAKDYQKKLFQELEEPLPEHHNLPSLLLTGISIEESIAELKNFLAGNLVITNSKTYQLIAGPSPRIKPAETSLAQETLTDREGILQKEYHTLYSKTNLKLKQIKEVSQHQEFFKMITDIDLRLPPNPSFGLEIHDLEIAIKRLHEIEREIDIILTAEAKKMYYEAHRRLRQPRNTV
jgi:hypothetical protein